jgi:hypothetical protein
MPRSLARTPANADPMRTLSATDSGLGSDASVPPPGETVLSFIAVSFCPRGALVSATARLVNDFCQVQFKDPDLCYRFRMAAHELAENVTKYAAGSRVSLRVDLLEALGRHRLRIKTKNMATAEHLREIEQRMIELKAAPSAMDLFDRLIRETAPLEGISGLGLVRIVAEGDLEVDYQIVGTELTLIAEGTVPRPPF